MTRRIEHLARLRRTIGKFVPQRCIIQASNHSEALEKGRRRLWDLGYETAGGTADAEVDQ